jgi:hypothetical protein
MVPVPRQHLHMHTVGHAAGISWRALAACASGVRWQRALAACAGGDERGGDGLGGGGRSEARRSIFLAVDETRLHATSSIGNLLDTTFLLLTL